MPDKPRIFISYFRKDGLDFARGRRKKLERKGFSLWQDIISLEGGRDFWLQITDALDHVEFMVLVLTDGAMQSPIVRKEWRYARQQGVCVYPVKGEPFSQDIHQSLSRWMRDAHYYDFDIEEQWQKLINDLHKSCETVRVPFMVEDKPDDFVEPPKNSTSFSPCCSIPSAKSRLRLLPRCVARAAMAKIAKVREPKPFVIPPRQDLECLDHRHSKRLHYSHFPMNILV